MKTGLEEKLKTLIALKETHLTDAQKLMNVGNNQMIVLDMLAIPVYNRSTSIISGFVTMIEKNNFICAAPLIRLQIDNYLRFYASSLVEDSSQFVIKVMEGKKISSFKDRLTGKKLHDTYLVTKATEFMPWLKRVYKETSGYIHFSSKHMSNSTKLIDNSGKFQMKVGDKDSYIPIELKVEAVDAMIEITSNLLSLLAGYVEYKDKNYSTLNS